MKKISFIFTMMALLLGLGTGVKAQTWDFTQSNADDVAALKAATSEWTYTEASDRYENKVAINGVVKAGSRVLALTEGLQVNAAENKLRIDNAKRLQLAGKNVTVTIPSLTKGQTVTIVFASTGDNAVTFDALTNLSGASGFTAADKNTTQTGTATVTNDGAVSFASTGGSINIFSIKVEGEGTTPGGDTGGNDPVIPANDHSAGQNTNVNQAILTLSNGTRKYYNTTSVSAIDIDGTTVTVRQNAGDDVFGNSVAGISFAKAEKSDFENPEGAVEILESKGWFESAYVKFGLFDGVEKYNVYVKGGQYNSYTKIDDQLVRNYGSYGRADAVGLMAGTYALKIVPVDPNGNELNDNANEATGLTVKPYDRTGYAHFNYSGVGAYNDDGTLKQGAKVFYVTKNTAKTITTTVAGAETNPCVGLQAIIAGYEKGGDTTPIAFRFIGKISKEDLDFLGSSSEGIQVKGRRADSEMNMTFEGIGDDATLFGFGFLIRNCKSVEFRNFANIRCMDDGLSLDTDNSNIWIHNLDLFYGKHGSGDHEKGDGMVDVKSDSKYVTVSYCHYWDTGKTNMFGMKNESGPNYISYHHNWFDHSDSRHPRVRTMSVHVWNNYFDNVAKYGVGATYGASVFVENNYFLKTKKPILSSLQGTDAMGSGTFSGEEGGMIKAYGNYFDTACKNFRYYTQNNPSATTGYDAYEVANRNDQVPETEVTKSGGHKYNNFDTNSSLIYSYTPDAAADVPAIVTGYWGAGRLNHGDFSYTFPDNVGDDDADSAYDATLGRLLDNYASSLVGIFGDEGGQGEGGGGQGGGEGGGDDPQPTPDGVIVGSFDGAPSNSMFTVAGDYGDGKITYNGTFYKKGVKMNSSGKITFTPQKNYNMTIVLSTSKNGRNVSINGVQTTVSGTTNTDGNYYEMEPIAITAGTQYVLTKGSVEGVVMLIILTPVDE
jgi:pectate lyase